MLSRTESCKYLSICLDGMGKERTKFPHFVQQPKKLADSNKIMLSLNLAVVHKTNEDCNNSLYGYFNTTNIHKNNTNVIASEIIHCISLQNFVPPVLFLQFDNYAANKSYLMLAIWGYFLINQSRIKEVNIEINNTYVLLCQYFLGLFELHASWTYPQ